MITNTDIKKLKDVFATKDDLKLFATKDDLDNSAQDSIELINSFRKELKGDIQDLRNEFYELKNEMTEFKKEIKDNLISFKDAIIHEIVKLREDMVVIRGWGDRIEDHETRIGKLEEKHLQ